jgi:hypothetical protein
MQSSKRMNSRSWINKYGTVAVLLMLLLVLNPELRAFLLVANFIGLDLMIFLFAIQLRYVLFAAPLFSNQTSTFLCLASYTTARVMTRTIGLLLAPCRATAGLTTFLFVLSKNVWCPTSKQGFREI